jgi:hypothetical protein
MLLRRDHTGSKTNCRQAPEKEAESALAGPKKLETGPKTAAGGKIKRRAGRRWRIRPCR